MNDLNQVAYFLKWLYLTRLSDGRVYIATRWIYICDEIGRIYTESDLISFISAWASLRMVFVHNYTEVNPFTHNAGVQRRARALGPGNQKPAVRKLDLQRRIAVPSL